MQSAADSLQPKFVCDAMLGKLARWLRLLGYDTHYSSACSDDELLARAGAEGRRILTRDVQLALRAGTPALLVRGVQVEAQLSEVLATLDAAAAPPPFSRCSLCNTSLHRVGGETLQGRVPEYVRRRHTVFSACPTCGRVYWGGTHKKKMARVLGAHTGQGKDSRA